MNTKAKKVKKKKNNKKKKGKKIDQTQRISFDFISVVD